MRYGDGVAFGVFDGVTVGVGPGQRLKGEGVGHGVHPVVAIDTLTGQLIAGAISAVRQTQPGATPTNSPGTTPLVASPAG